MKQAQVQIGAVYVTRVSNGPLAPVVVVDCVGRRFSYATGREEGPQRYRVRRLGSQKPLPGTRTAAALHEVPETVVHMKGQPWGVHVRREFDPKNPTRKSYTVSIPEFKYTVTSVDGDVVNAATAAVLVARALVAATIFEGRQ